MNRVERMAGEDEAAPPVAVCVRCGLEACPGCAPEPVLASGLPWEDSRRNWVVRLWQTARVSGVEPERTFGELRAGSVGSPLVFALLAETLAIGSLLFSATLLAWLCAPNWVRPLLHHPAAALAMLGLLAGSVVVMLVLHLLWGVSLDVGGSSAGGRLDVRQGARFGLYACGWDLMTSPIGLLCALLLGGPLQGWSFVASAARAAKPAQRAYLETCQGLGADACRRALRLAVVVIIVAMVLLGLGLCGALVWLAHRFGY